MISDNNLDSQTVFSYNHATNCSVIHLPGRKYPAIAIQGDTLYSLLMTTVSSMEQAKASRNQELYYGSLMLAEQLKGYLLIYEKMLSAQGFERPYPTSVNTMIVEDDWEPRDHDSLER